jgi:hypothetical protein
VYRDLGGDPLICRLRENLDIHAFPQTTAIGLSAVARLTAPGWARVASHVALPGVVTDSCIETERGSDEAVASQREFL